MIWLKIICNNNLLFVSNFIIMTNKKTSMKIMFFIEVFLYLKKLNKEY